MAQLRDTCIHGILDADKYIVSKYGYNVARFNEGVHNINDTYIEFGDAGVTSKLIGRTVTIRSSNSINALVHDNHSSDPPGTSYTKADLAYYGLSIDKSGCYFSISDGFYTNYSGMGISVDGASIYGQQEVEISAWDYNKVKISGQIKISNHNYGTKNPADKVQEPVEGCIYFKIIS